MIESYKPEIFEFPYSVETKKLFSTTVFVPPSVNHQWKPGKGGFVNSKEYRSWKKNVVQQFQMIGITYSHYKNIKYPIDYDVCVALRINLNKRSDVTNYEKGIYDALEAAGILKNDNLIRLALTMRSPVAYLPKQHLEDRTAEVIIYRINETDYELEYPFDE